MPSPCIETPVAEYSQSIRCMLVSPGAFTSLPTNHDSGDGQYSVTVTPVSQWPRACLLGGGGMRGVVLVGASPPPTIGAPPFGGADESRAVAAPVTETVTSAVRTATASLDVRFLPVMVPLRGQPAGQTRPSVPSREAARSAPPEVVYITPSVSRVSGAPARRGVRARWPRGRCVPARGRKIAGKRIASKRSTTARRLVDQC